MLKNLRFLPAVEMTNLPNPTFYESINVDIYYNCILYIIEILNYFTEIITMVRSLKVLIIYLPFIISLSLVRPIPMAEASFLYPGDILVDDFEYEGCISYSHGWTGPDPATYPPTYGYSSAFHTVLDLQQGSRVLDVYRPTSIFLIGTPYAQHRIAREIDVDARTHGVISFDFKAPPYNEPGQSFQMVILCSNADGDEINICLVPTDIQNDGNSSEDMDGTMIIESEEHSVTVGLGPSLLDDSWHTVWIDLVDIVQKANGISVPTDPKDYLIRRVDYIQITSGIFRLDNIIMRADQWHTLCRDPHLFQMGTLYAQISEPCRYLFIADCKGTGITVFDRNGQAQEINRITDLMLNPNNFLFARDPDDPNDPVVKYWTDLGADPDLFGQMDPNMADFLNLPFFIVDFGLPIFADENLRMTPEGPGPLAKLIGHPYPGTLGWSGTATKYDPEPTYVHWGVHGPIEPLTTCPYDGMPTYIPVYYAAMKLVKKLGRPYYSPDLVSMLEGALWNAGIPIWPNIGECTYTPQEFADLRLTILVTNGRQSDTGEVWIRVVNYPTENYSPVYQLPDQELIYYVGESGAHHITFIDPDCFIFSMLQLLSGTPATDHNLGLPVNEDFRKDMDHLYWRIGAIDGVNIITYPDDIMDEIVGVNGWESGDFGSTGLLTLEPEHEGTHDMVVTCQDTLGGSGAAELGILFVSKSDRDSDYILDYLDNCPDTRNTDQTDTDQDGLGDACDPCPLDPNNDRDGDGVCESEGDCNDNDASIYPGATGTHAGKDNDCSGVIDNDEKKRTSQVTLYPGYIPVLFPWLQTLPYGNLNYQLPLTVSWSPIKYPISRQQPWFAGYPSAFDWNPQPQRIFQSGPFQFPFIRTNWPQTYIRPWDLIYNQLP